MSVYVHAQRLKAQPIFSPRHKDPIRPSEMMSNRRLLLFAAVAAVYASSYFMVSGAYVRWSRREVSALPNETLYISFVASENVTSCQWTTPNGTVCKVSIISKDPHFGASKEIIMPLLDLWGPAASTRILSSLPRQVNETYPSCAGDRAVNYQGMMMYGDCSIAVSPFNVSAHVGPWTGEAVAADGTALKTMPPVQAKVQETIQEMVESLTKGIIEVVQGLIDFIDRLF